MPKVKVTIMSEVKSCLKWCCLETTVANLMKLHRKIKHNEKVCRAQDVGSDTAKVKVAIRSAVKIVSQQ